MKYSIMHSGTFNSRRKAASIYRRLVKKAFVPKEDIIFNCDKNMDVVFYCDNPKRDVYVNVRDKHKITLDYREIVEYFFIESGYKGKIIFKPSLK